MTRPVPTLPPSLKDYMPHIVWGGLGLAFTLISAMTFLIAIGKPTDDLSRLLNTAANLVTVVLSGGGFLYAKKATDAANVTAVQTNGGLDDRIKAQVHQALVERDTTRIAGQDPATPSM